MTTDHAWDGAEDKWIDGVAEDWQDPVWDDEDVDARRATATELAKVVKQPISKSFSFDGKRKAEDLLKAIQASLA
jgi:hypothetical protein